MRPAEIGIGDFRGLVDKRGLREFNLILGCALSRPLVDTPNLAPYTHFLKYVTLGIEVAYSAQVRHCDPRQAAKVLAFAHATPRNSEREALRWPIL